MKEDIIFHLRGGEDFIPLIGLLKTTNLVESGSEAQSVVSMGMVMRNGAIEFRKRAKIRTGEEIEFGNTIIKVI